MKKITFLSVLILTTSIPQLPTLASGIPVFDASSFAQLVSQLEQAAKEYEKQLDQLEEAVSQTQAITGTRDMGNLANDNLERELRRYLPDTWQETLDMLNASGLAGSTSGTRGIYENLQESFDPVSGADLLISAPNSPDAQAVDRRTGTTFAAAAASEQAFNNIARRIQTYEMLLNELNQTEDLKASVDLQARIAAENGLLMNDLMRLQTIKMQQDAAEDIQNLTSQRRSATANKYDATKAADSFSIKKEN